jgi:pyrimidine deaminase RibD-like protein
MIVNLNKMIVTSVLLILPTVSSFVTVNRPGVSMVNQRSQQQLHQYRHRAISRASSSYHLLAEFEASSHQQQPATIDSESEVSDQDDDNDDEDEQFVFPPNNPYFFSQEEIAKENGKQNGKNGEDDITSSFSFDVTDIDQDMLVQDERFMRMAIDVAQAAGGERGPSSAYPNPTTGAVLVANDGRILGKGRSDFSKDAIQNVLIDAGLSITPLREWCITWPSSLQLRNDLSSATLYVTLEPDSERHGQALPPLTQLTELSGISRIVIGVASPIPEYATKGAKTLHQAGLEVSMGLVCVDECQALIEQYTERAHSKLQVMARQHRRSFQRPLGFLHCSVVDSSDLEAFAQHGNAFGKSFGGQTLSFRNFGAYEFAPPPEQIWADDSTEEDEQMKYLMGMELDNDDDDDDDAMLSLDFEEEKEQERLGGVSMMPWYEQVDAVIATFPHEESVLNGFNVSRLNGLKWLSTYGKDLPAGVERILVMDATDLEDLPLTNDHPNLPPGVDVEQFWTGEGRRPTRVLLRKGRSTQAQAAARAAAE